MWRYKSGLKKLEDNLKVEGKENNQKNYTQLFEMNKRVGGNLDPKIKKAIKTEMTRQELPAGGEMTEGLLCMPKTAERSNKSWHR